MRAAILAAPMLCAAVAAHAQTAADRAACTPDALRLCDGAAIARAAGGDRSGVIACFRTHRRELSAACATAIAKHQKDQRNAR